MVQITYAHPHFAFAGRKQRIKNSDWIDAFGKIAQLVSKKELDQLVEKTVKDIKKKTKGKKAAYAWSGGKDSLVLGELCQRAGITPCILVICNLEYKAFIEWLEGHKPPELSIINTGQDMKWLFSHLQMLFPQDSKFAARWFCPAQGAGEILQGAGVGHAAFWEAESRWELCRQGR